MEIGAGGRSAFDAGGQEFPRGRLDCTPGHRLDSPLVIFPPVSPWISGRYLGFSRRKEGRMLEDIPLFSTLNAQTLRFLEGVAVKRAYPKNAILISEGDRSDQLFTILSGKIKVVIMDPEGKEIVVNLLGPGDCFGELAMIDGETRSATIVTTEPTQVLTIGRADFTPILTSNPDFMYSLLKVLAAKVRAATSMVESLAFEDVYARLVRLLTNLARPRDNLLVVEEKLTHQEIANMIGSSREVVSRMLKALSVGGYISIDQKRICIKGKLPRSY